ncbi:hypothetical protein CUMW_254310, partial [Citrus unshiu]
MEENEEPTYDLDLEGKPRRNLTKKKDLQRGVSDETEEKSKAVKEKRAKNVDMAENEEPTYDLDLEGRPRRNLTRKKNLQRGVSDETEEKSKAAKEKRAKNVYNHHFGSTRYDGWTSEFLSARLTASELRSQVEQGTFQSQGPNDILCEIL